jgi:hypothetical protein
MLTPDAKSWARNPSFFATDEIDRNLRFIFFTLSSRDL